MMHANLRSRHNCPSKVKYIYNWKLGTFYPPPQLPQAHTKMVCHLTYKKT